MYLHMHWMPDIFYLYALIYIHFINRRFLCLPSYVYWTTMHSLELRGECYSRKDCETNHKIFNFWNIVSLFCKTPIFFLIFIFMLKYLIIIWRKNILSVWFIEWWYYFSLKKRYFLLFYYYYYIVKSSFLII